MRFDVMPVATEKQILELEKVAPDIWRNYYKDIFPEEQLEYMIKLFCSGKAIREQIQQGHIHLILLLDYQIAGYICYHAKDDCLYMPRLYIKPEYRNRGLAKQVFERLEKIFLSPEHGFQQIKKIRMNLSVKNDFAINIYEHLGFKKIREVTVDLGNGYTSKDYIMEKIIKPKKDK